MWMSFLATCVYSNIHLATKYNMCDVIEPERCSMHFCLDLLFSTLIVALYTQVNHQRAYACRDNLH